MASKSTAASTAVARATGASPRPTKRSRVNPQQYDNQQAPLHDHTSHIHTQCLCHHRPLARACTVVAVASSVPVRRSVSLVSSSAVLVSTTLGPRSPVSLTRASLLHSRPRTSACVMTCKACACSVVNTHTSPMSPSLPHFAHHHHHHSHRPVGCLPGWRCWPCQGRLAASRRGASLPGDLPRLRGCRPLPHRWHRLLHSHPHCRRRQPWPSPCCQPASPALH